jgi:hypothetical protein
MNLLLDTRIITDYTTLAVSLADAKKYMKVSFSDDDAVITSLIKNATVWLENYTGKSYGSRRVEITIELNAREFYELNGPVTTLHSIEQVGQGTFTTGEYELFGNQIKVYTSGIYYINFTYGFTTIPEDAKNDILSITAYTYQNRGIDFSNEAATPVDFPMLATQYQRRVPI